MYAMVCGGSRVHPSPAALAWLHGYVRAFALRRLILGGAARCNVTVQAWAKDAGIPTEPIPTDWHPGNAHGAIRVAGYLRLLTRYMSGQLCLLALPGGEGTAYVAAQAQRLGLPVYVYTEETSMTETKKDAVESPIPMLEDDIADVPVPATLAKTLQDAPGQAIPPPPWGEHEALLQGFLGHLLGCIQREVLHESRDILELVKATIRLIDTAASKQAEINDHAQYQLSDALTKLQTQGLQVRQDPYTATVRAMSPEGYAVEIGIAKQDTGDLINALPMLTNWLMQSGYKPLP